MNLNYPNTSHKWLVLAMAIAPSPNDKVQIQMIYRTITPDQKGALERTITKLLPVSTRE
ncbi:MAG: hypothetical protein AAGA75_17120 [Cyanobacteria bacterium P01_E01_bin.6]